MLGCSAMAPLSFIGFFSLRVRCRLHEIMMQASIKTASVISAGPWVMQLSRAQADIAVKAVAPLPVLTAGAAGGTTSQDRVNLAERGHLGLYGELELERQNGNCGRFNAKNGSSSLLRSPILGRGSEEAMKTRWGIVQRTFFLCTTLTLTSLLISRFASAQQNNGVPGSPDATVTIDGK